MDTSLKNKIFNATVLIAGLGYMIDMYDLILFAITRVSSLTELGLTGVDITKTGVTILNLQFAGLLLGAILWGILADKFGRKTCLYGSVLIYSVSMILISFVQNVEQLAILRFIIGIGLAGEVGAGIALISERMTPEKRGQGVAVFAALGFFGVVIAGLMTQFVDWRTAHLIGGISGLLLLLIRSMLNESEMFLEYKKSEGTYFSRIFQIFKSKQKITSLLKVTFVGIPFAICIGCVTALAPEMAKSKGITDKLNMGYVLIIFNLSWILSDIIIAKLSDYLRSRRKVVAISITAYALLVLSYFVLPLSTPEQYYIFVSLFGFSVGYFSIVNIIGAEIAEIHYRGVFSTIVPNLTRFYVVPATTSVLYLSKDYGFSASYVMIALLGVVVSFSVLRFIPETFGRDLSRNK